MIHWRSETRFPFFLATCLEQISQTQQFIDTSDVTKMGYS